MTPETLSSFFKVFQNQFFYSGIICVLFYVAILDNKVGDALFGTWLQFIIHSNSCVFYIMIVLSAQRTLNAFSRVKKGIEEIKAAKDEDQ